MDAPVAKKKFNWMGLITLALFIILIILLIVWIYKHFFQFNNNLVRSYINREANTYEDPDLARKLITEGVEAILKSSDMTNQVLIYSKKSGLDREKVLVDTAVVALINLDYIGHPAA